MNQLIEHIKRNTEVNAELEEQLEHNFTEEHFSSGVILLRENKPVRKLYYIRQGTIRTYYNHDGKDVTTWFYGPDQFTTSWYGFYNQTGAHEFLEVLEETEVYTIDKKIIVSSLHNT